jgi:hypothetical protein
MTVRRILGLVLLPIGLALIVASTCDWLLAIADYFDITQAWGATCPDAFRAKALLIAGVMVAVIGQRLYSGRDLKTGVKPDTLLP